MFVCVLRGGAVGADDKHPRKCLREALRSPIVIGIPLGSWEVLCAWSKSESLKLSRSVLFAGDVRLID